MPAVAVAEGGHGRNIVLDIGLIGYEVLRVNSGLLAVDNGQRLRIGHNEFFSHVADFSVAQDQHGLTETLGKVERLDCKLIALGDRAGRKSNRAVVAVRAPAGLHDILLRGLSRKSR